MLQVILLNGVLREEGKGDPCVLAVLWLEGCVQVHVGNVKYYILFPFCAPHTVPHYLCCGQVGSLCLQFAGVGDQVTTCCHANTVGVLLLREKVDYKARVSGGFALWYLCFYNWLWPFPSLDG